MGGWGSEAMLYLFLGRSYQAQNMATVRAHRGLGVAQVALESDKYSRRSEWANFGGFEVWRFWGVFGVGQKGTWARPRGLPNNSLIGDPRPE